MSDEERRPPASVRPSDAVSADLATVVDAATVVETADLTGNTAGDATGEAPGKAPGKADVSDIAEAATVVAASEVAGSSPATSEAESMAAMPPTQAEISDVEGLAPTRVLEEEDKTAPPPVVAPASGAATPRATPAQAPRPAAAPKSRGEDRGLRPGTILFGEYEIVSVLGAGGMGEVYRARHRRLDEHRAIKVMHAEMSKRRGASEFFYREAKALLAVRHPAVVHCHDLLSDDAGRVYLIMEMIEGIPLSKRLNDGPLSPDDVAILGARVAHGLAAAHRKGVIHRDLSPDNIVLPGGRVHEAKIIDFGIAKLLEQGEGTIVDGFKGKLSYASPEQLGFFGGKIDGRSDLYSLGLVLAAAALGRPMAMGTTVMEAVDSRRSLKGLPDGIPMGLRSAIQPLLALNPEDRPKYVDRLFVVPGALDPVSDSGLYSTPKTGPARPRRPFAAAAAPSNRTGLVLAAAGSTALIAATLFYFGVFGSTTGETADSALVSPSPASNADQRASATGVSGTTSEADTGAKAAPTGIAGGGGTTEAGRANLAASRNGAVVGEQASQDAEVARVAQTPAPDEQPSAPIARVAPEPARAPSRAPAPAPVRKSGPSASERIKIVGMLQGAKLALGEGHLMSPPGDNAYDRYRSVLRLDPNNAAARSGLREIASRFVGRANAAIDQGDMAAARDELRRARQADSSLPAIRAAEARLAGS